MKRVFQKIKIFIPFILLGIYFMLFIKWMPIEPYDELWNFQNVLKIYNGYELYVDANVIITPLFYFFALIVFKIFGATMISFRIYNVILSCIYFILIYLILRQLNVSKHIAGTMLTLTLVLVSVVINGGANYNLLALIFMLLGVLFYLKYYDEKCFNYLQGLIIFFVFISKQNLGVYYACSIFVYELMTKTSWKNYIINQVKKVFVLIVCLVVFAICLNVNGILYGFINYAFGGLFDFGKTNVAFSTPFHLLIYALVAVTVVVTLSKYGKNVCTSEFLKKLYLITCVAIGATFSCYPIFNTAHVLYILIFYLLILFYFLDYAMLEDIFGEKKYINPCIVMSSFLIFALIARFGFVYLDLLDGFTKIDDSNSKYNNLYIYNEYYEKINVLKDYINENDKDVIVLTYDAALVMVELEKNNGELDLAFVGNLGYDGENKLIEKINNLENTEILIFTDEEDRFWQESDMVREYILNNLDKVGEILEYSIYECN